MTYEGIEYEIALPLEANSRTRGLLACPEARHPIVREAPPVPDQPQSLYTRVPSSVMCTRDRVFAAMTWEWQSCVEIANKGRLTCRQVRDVVKRLIPMGFVERYNGGGDRAVPRVSYRRLR